MITNSAINSVRPLVEAIRAKGVTLRVADGTPLDAAVSVLWGNISKGQTVRVDGEIVDPETVGETDYLRAAGARKNEAGYSDYAAVKADVVQTLVQSVSRMMNTARNVVNPIIRDLTQAIETEYAQQVESSAIPLSILPNIYNKFWDSTAIRGSLANYETTPAKLVALGGFPPMDEGALWDKVKPTAARLAKDMEEYLQDMPTGWLLTVYSRLFSGQNDDLIESSAHVAGLENERNYVLTGYLIAQALYAKEPLEGYRGGLENYRDRLRDTVIEFGRLAERQIQKREREATQGIMVLKVPHVTIAAGMRSANIVVNAAVYNKWLSRGGSPEILLGAMCVDKETDPDALLEKAEVYTATWERNVRLFESYYKARRNQHIVEIMRGKIYGVMKELEAKDELPVELPAVQARVNQVIQQCPNALLADIPRYVTKIVCDGIYPHTRAGDVLATIEQICEGNPELDPREAALYAAIDLLADFMAEQIIEG